MSSEESASKYKPLSRGSVITSRYEVEKYLGESLLGPTYVVKNIETEKWLALKFIRPEYKPPEAVAEVKALMQKVRAIQHPNVVRYGNVGDYGGMIFFTQEYFPSINLRQLMIDYQADEREFSIKEAFSIVIKMLEAIRSIHAQGIFHTNVKPENVLIRERTSEKSNRVVREVKITDLMAASILGPDKITDSPYRAPECRLEYSVMSDIGAPADIFSVGNILYELLVGRPATGTYLSPSQMRDDLGSSVDNIVDVALHAQAAHRYNVADDMLRNIELTFSDALVEEKSSADSRKLLQVFGAAMLALLVLGAFFVFREKPDVEDAQEAKDDEIRQQVHTEIMRKLPSEEEMKAYYAKYPDMLYIPAGPALIGSLNREFTFGLSKSTDSKAQKIEVEGFYIDRFEYPNRKQDADGNAIEPITGVTFEIAKQECERQEKRLCTTYEWEKACRGYESYVYSYGDTYDEELCGKRTEYKLGEKIRCSSTYGVFGMSGGPREWTSTPSPSSPDRYVIKGGDFSGQFEKIFRCSHTASEVPTYKDKRLAFRCCRSAEKK